MDIDANTVLAFDFESGPITNVPELTGSTGSTWSWGGYQAAIQSAWPMRDTNSLLINRMTGTYPYNAIVNYTRACVAAIRSNNWTMDFCLTVPYYDGPTNAMLQSQSGVGSILQFYARFSGYRYAVIQLQNYGRDIYFPISGPAAAFWSNVITPFARQHIVIRRNNATDIELFVNGVSKGAQTCPQYSLKPSEDHEFYIGGHTTNAWYGMQIWDNFRLSNITRDNAWVAAQSSCEIVAPTPKLIAVTPKVGPKLGLTFDLPVGITGPTIGPATAGLGITGAAQVDATNIDLTTDYPPVHPLGTAEELPVVPDNVRRW